MFRCTDCKKEYAQCPDYCDCGNNVFEEIGKNTANKNTTSRCSQKTQPAFHQQTLSPLDKIGIGVFAICIILSLCAFIFIGAGNKNTNNSNNKPILTKDYSIPVDINEIWDNTP